MIVPLEKLFIACRRSDMKQMLHTIRSASCLHLEPSKPLESNNSDHFTKLITQIESAIRILQQCCVSKTTKFTWDCNLSTKESQQLVAHILETWKTIQELETGLHSIQEDINRHTWFGQVHPEDVLFIRSNGLDLRFFRISTRELPQTAPVHMELLSWNQLTSTGVVGLVGPNHINSIPPKFEALSIPDGTLSALKERREAINQRLERENEKLLRMSRFMADLQRLRSTFQDKKNWNEAVCTAFKQESIFALQGWISANAIPNIKQRFSDARIDVALMHRPPTAEETPPTLLTHHRFIKPVAGLFPVLGSYPGYNEVDIAGIFSIALPIFCALLIADGGYGLLLILLASIFITRISSESNRSLTVFLIMVGAVTLIWGLLISSFFGIGKDTLMSSQGSFAIVSETLTHITIFEGAYTDDTVVALLMRLSFVIGTVHMSIARIWRSIHLYPSPEMISHVGFGVFLWGILLSVNTLVLEDPVHPLMKPLLLAGGGLAILFSFPKQPWFRRLLYGMASFPLTAVSALSDTISYIRLMAVGLASTILAATFNELAIEASQQFTWGAGVTILVIGHSLNLGLAMVALFAHGVRLNMLEFSNHLGLSWTGYPFRPFTLHSKKEN